MERGRGSPGKVARIFGVDRRTVQRYCQAAVSGEPSKLQDVQRNPISGRYSINLDEARTVLARSKEQTDWSK